MNSEIISNKFLQSFVAARPEWLDSVHDILQKHIGENDRMLVAVSGGADSMGLLTLLRWELCVPADRIVAGHVNHLLRKDANEDWPVVKRWANQLDCVADYAETDANLVVWKDGLSVEAAARKVRYEALQTMARRHNCQWILTGHTLEDSAETVLMRMNSGAPWYECTGIPELRGNILRPLICSSRYKLREWVENCAIPFREDWTNRDPRFLRNRLRHWIESASDQWNFLKLQQYACYGANLHRVLWALFDSVIDVTQVEEQQGLTPYFGLAIERILAYFTLLNWLPVEAAWCKVTGRVEGRLSSAMRRQVSDCLTGKSDNVEFELSKGIHFLKRGDKVWIFREPLQTPEISVGLGQFHFENINRTLEIALRVDGSQSSAEHLLDRSILAGALAVRHWRPGDRIRPLGRPTTKVSDYLNATKFNPIERRQTLVLADEHGPLMILGNIADERALTKNKIYGIKVTWKETCRT